MMRLTICAAAACAMAAPAAALAHPADAAINSVYARLAAARQAGDIPGVMTFFAPEGLLIDDRPLPALSGAQLEAQIRPALDRLNREQVRLETAYRIERRSVMGDIAIDAGFMRQTLVRPNAEPNIRYARFMVTMRRGADGAWAIIGDAAMQAREASWTALARTDGLHYDG